MFAPAIFFSNKVLKFKLTNRFQMLIKSHILSIYRKKNKKNEKHLESDKTILLK